MSRDWTSRVLTVAIVVLMVTSTLAPVAAAGSPSTPTAPAGSNSNSFDFSGIDTDNVADDDGAPAADVGTSPVQLATSMPFYAEPELQRVEVDLGSPTSNGDGTVKVPVHVKGEYRDGQYPWRVPVSVRIESGELSESAVVNLAPQGTSDDPQDYRASTQFTLQFVQDGTTNHAITATAISQVGERDANGNLVREGYLRDSDAETISVNGVSDESDVTTSGDIRNDDVSEPPNEVSHVTRFRASERASDYLEDSSLPVGTESKVENFTYTRDANNKHAVFQSFRGDMMVGTLTSNVPNGSSQTVVIRYRSLTNEDVQVTPVDSSGSEMDGGTDYVLPADPSDSDRCHEGEDADICIFRLSSNEVAEIGQQNELILAYYSQESAALAVFCQDTVTGGMPESGEVCGLGDVSSYAEGRIVGLRAVDVGSGNSASEESTLSVNQGANVRIDVVLENRGNTPTSGTVQLTTTDPTNYEAQTEDVTLSGGERTTVSFSGYSMAKTVQFDVSFEKSDTWVEVAPTGLADSANPVSVPGGPYIVPLEELGQERTKLGLQEQTLSERPGPQWTKITNEGSSGGTDEWTTYVYRVPVVGTIDGLEATSDNVSYINSQLTANHEGTVTVQEAYGEYLNNAKRQLPANTDSSEWTLHDIQFTTNIETETRIDTERPDGYGWRKVDKYGSVATGEYEQDQFRSLPNGSEANQGGTIIDTDGSGWVKQDDIPPEERLTGYVYNNSSEDPDFYEEDDMNDGDNDWEEYKFVETRYVLEDRINWEHRYQEQKYDPGGNWTFVDEMDNGTYHYNKRTYKEVEVWTYRKPVYHWYYTYERPVTATSYEWERQVYDAKFIFQKSASSGTESLWQGPLYKWESQYESETLTLDGDRSYDLGPVDDRGLAAYEWEFDDGTTSERGPSANTTNRQYSTPFGVYHPSLTVWDHMGNSATNQTEVHVIPQPLDCESPCDPYAAIPDLSASEKRDPIDYQMQTVDYKVDLSGKLYDREWTVNITAPDANGSFEQEIWRSYDIVGGEEEIHGQINPRVHELGPGAVEFVVTATPADSSEPRVVDTFEVYLCHQDLSGFSPEEEGCMDQDPDGDNTPNSHDSDPYCNESNNAEEDTTCYCARNPDDPDCDVRDWLPSETGYVLQSADWDTVWDWESSESRRHMTLVGSGAGHPDTKQGTLRIGYERNLTMQDNLYRIGDDGLIAFYDMEKDDLYYSNDPDDWWLSDDSPYPNYRVPVFADKNANSNGGDFQNGNNADGKYADRAPRFGTSGVFGSNGVHFDTETHGFFEFVSPYDCVGCAGWLTGGDEDDRAGEGLSDELYNDATISFWARDTSVRESKNEYNEAHWTMQAEHNHGFDSAVQNLHIAHTCDSMSGEFAAATKCATPAMSPSDLHYLQRWHSEKSGVSESLASKKDLNNEDVTGMETFSDGQWHHYAFVTEGGTGYGDAVKLYIDGELEYSRTFSETYGSNADYAYFTFNNAPDSHKMTRFIWGGSWSDTSGLVRQMQGMRYDNIRIHNEALTQYEVSETENIDNHGFLNTGPKWLNYSHDAYNTSNGVNVSFDGYIPYGNSVDVQVIPWEDGSPNYAASDTATFTFGETREEVTLATETISRASIRVDAHTDNPTQSPQINKVAVLALEEVQYNINNTDPVAVMFSNASDVADSGTRTIDSGDVINFVGDRSTDDTGNITTYQYKVDGPAGAEANEQSGRVTSGSEIPDYQNEFKCGGEQTVSLTVADEFGGVNSTSMTFNVENDKPIANPTPTDTTISPGDTVNFDGTDSRDPDGDIINYEWHFEHADQSDYNPSTSWTYEEPGEYFVNFTVTDDGCEQDTERVRVMVQNDPPTADAGDDQTVGTDEEVTFDGSDSTEPNGDELTYDWDIDGDGNYELTNAGAQPTHTYSNEGTRTVTLRVSDPYGGSDTDTMRVTVDDPWDQRTWIDADFDDGWDGFSSARGAGRGTHTYDSYQYSAYVKGYSNSRIVSPSVDLSDARGVSLDYWMQRGDNSFSEQPDSGENMRLQYRTSSGGWSTIKTYYGSGTNGQVYRESINLPSGAYHDNFAIRYRLTDTSGSNFDYYHMDEVRLTGEEYTGPVGAMNEIGETGTMTVTADDGNWQTLNFQNDYSNPVVIMKPLSYDGSHPSHIRLRNVDSNSAQAQIEEWDYLDGPHATATAHYVVMEQGDWTLDDGTQVVAGTVNTDDSGTSVSFPSSFSGTPVVFTQDQTRNGGDPAVTRNWNVGSSGFNTRMQEEEANGGHTTETIGYIAINQGTGSTGGINFEAYREGNSFTESWRQINFARSYDSDRNVILDMQTEDGGNTAGLRYKDFNSGNVDAFVEEETSSDSETSHNTESVGYWVFDSDGSIVGGGGDGSSSGSTTPPKYKLTSNSYSASYDGTQACREEFGSNYEISSWEEIESDYNQDAMKMRSYFDSTPTDGGRTVGRATYNGNEHSGSYAWWVAHEPDRYVDNSGAYVADGTGSGRDHYLWVGRWDGNYKVMCENPNGEF